jgi:muramoyltetrapeptide carboxypeptidase
MNALIPPHNLQKGDKVAIIATARKISEQELLPALELLQQWGLKPVLGKNCYAVHHQFAGTDAQRAADLQWALDDESIKAIIAVRGGYGTVRIVDAVNFAGFQKQPKWMVGYKPFGVSEFTRYYAH